MQIESSAPRDGVAVSHGYGIKIYVERGHLVVHDGVGRKRETRRFARATSGLTRLFVIGHTGYITFEAARWLREIGAAYAQVDTGGKVVLISGSTASDHAPLRRAQSLAPYVGSGVAVARLLLTEKTDGQAALLPELLAQTDGRRSMERARRAIGDATDVDELLASEAAAATAYWGAWAAVEVPFGERDAMQVPQHWCVFGQRHSPLTGSPRLAVNPANAILNYLYALLEVEASLACSAVGLDPGLGVFHADRKGRDSLALDVMEACRPLADAYLLTLLRHRTLNRKDFTETRRGDCRLHTRLARELAGTATAWRASVGPVAERVAKVIGESAPKPLSLPTPLTGGERRTAWDARRTPTGMRRPVLARLPASCRGCGVELADRRRRYCDACRRESAARAGQTGRAAASAALARLRDEGRDPAHGGEAAARRGRKNAAHQQAVKSWNANSSQPSDPSLFQHEILPGLVEVTLSDLVQTTGLSRHYCSLIRLGKRVPHPRHWDALANIRPRGPLPLAFTARERESGSRDRMG